MPTKVLYTVLNWGLGHASRSIPIIQYLLNKKIEVIIASDGEALVLLKKEFPNAYFEKLVSYNIEYAKKAKNFERKIFFQLKKLNNAIKEEQKQTKELIKKHQITHLISDNRYGCYSDKIPSTIICHQLTLQHKNSVIQAQINKIHHKLLNKFNEIWAPDFEDELALAGSISKTNNSVLQSKLSYIGLLSRMNKETKPIVYDICIILSGPEPQRSILETILLKEIERTKYKIAFVRGTNHLQTTIKNSEKIEVYQLLKTTELEKIINQSKIVICRAGYSSIMDLIKLNKQAVLIPTPGQTEQEYLGKHLNEKKSFYSVNQEEFELKEVIQKMETYYPKNNKGLTIYFQKTIVNYISND